MTGKSVFGLCRHIPIGNEPTTLRGLFCQAQRDQAAHQ